MSGSGPLEGMEGGRSGRRRKKTRVRERVRTGPTGRQRIKKWWRAHRGGVLFWAVAILSLLVLFALIATGLLLPSKTPPPAE